MSALFSSGPDDQGENLPAFDDTVTPRGSKRALLAGVAALAVLAGGGGGLFWLAGSPAADASAVAQPTGSGAFGVPEPTGAETTSPGIALSGREIVAAPETDSGTGSSPVTSTPSAAAVTSSAAVPTGTSSSSVATTGSKPATTRATVKPSTAPTTPRATPTPSRSTAAPWQPGSVRFEGVDVPSLDGSGAFVLDTKGPVPAAVRLYSGDLVPSTSTVYKPVGEVKERDMTDDEATACNDSVKAAATQEDAAAIIRKTVNCKRVVDSVWAPLLLRSSDASGGGQAPSGWVLGVDADLPAAALGKVTGTVRFLGERSKAILVQIDNKVPVWVAEGQTVPGTPLTYTGQQLDAPKRTGVAVFTSGGNTYFTAPGGGEKSGITF